MRPTNENIIEIVALTSCILAIIVFSIFIKVALYKWKARRQISDILLDADFSMCLNKRAKGSEDPSADTTKVTTRPGGSLINFSTGTSRKSSVCLSNTCGLSQDLISFFLFICTFLSLYVMVTVTSLTLHRILNSSARKKAFSSIFVVMEFLSLSGGKFASIVLLLLSDNDKSQTDNEYFYYLANRLDSPLSTWESTAFSYVTLFVFFWNTVPMNLALYQIANRKSREQIKLLRAECNL